MAKKWTIEAIRAGMKDGSIKKGKFKPVEVSYVPPFRKSYHFANENRNWKLVHAKIFMVPTKWKVLSKVESKPHAWCEAHNMVYDPEFDLYMNKKTYYKLFKVKGRKEYGYQEMIDMLKKKRRYGRWEEILWFE